MQAVNNTATTIGLQTIVSFIRHDNFFYYHGYVLTTLWIIGCTFGILLKRINLILHALSFFLIDVTTLYFIIGAWLRVYPHLDQISSWSLLKQGHVIGGAIFGILLIVQHLWGVKTFLGSKKSKGHRSMAYFLTNIARVIAYCGWIFGNHQDKQQMVNYVLIATVLLFILSSISFFTSNQKKHQNPQNAQKPKKKRQ